MVKHTCTGGTGDPGERTENVSKGWAGQVNNDHGSSSLIAVSRKNSQNKSKHQRIKNLYSNINVMWSLSKVQWQKP